MAALSVSGIRAGRDHLLRPLPAHRHPRRERRLRDADHERLLLRRQAPARHVRDPGPRERHARQGVGGHAGGRHRRRGPHVLLEPRHRHPGHHPRRARQRAERRDHRRRLHHHAAVRQDPVPLAGAVVHPQGPRGDPLDQDPQPAQQAGDPRGLPQHHLLRQRRLRRPGRLTDVLRQAGLQARRPGVRRARHHAQPTVVLRPLLRGRQGADDAALRVRHRRHGEVRRDLRRRRRTRPRASCRRSRSRRTTTASRARTATCSGSCRSR